MQWPKMIVVADANDPALDHLRSLARTRAQAETALREATTAERAEIARLIETNTAGPVAIAAAIGRTREAVRLSMRQWRKEHPDR